MNDPTEKNEPKDDGENEMDNCHTKASLKKLPQPWNEETTQSSKYVAPRTLPRHRQASYLPFISSAARENALAANGA